MRYKSFRIRNFKGIKDTTVDFTAIGGASVFAFVGLNESGKTTVLEAIHSFSPDTATSELVGGEDGGGVPFNDRVPRHLISSFSGECSVLATIELTDDDKKQIAHDLLNEHKIIVDVSRITSQITFDRMQRFKNGDFSGSFFTLTTPFFVKGPKQRSWRELSVAEQIPVRDTVFRRVPSVAYFPTFVFDFPESIFLTDRGSKIDRFYRRVFQDILDFDNLGHNIEKDIIRRVREKERRVPWVDFFSAWMRDDSDRDKIQHVMDRASAAVTRLVFGRWNRIFREDVKGKEINISYHVVEGEKKDEKGIVTKTTDHDVYINFKIKDNTRRFNVNDRSLGFRWFFAFMLFTQFRVARNKAQPLVFLFDEPASNLHAAAQQKLIESFPEIAQGDHILAYTTHSHYMIEPKWLEQTFIVTNRADAPADSVLDAVSLDEESLDIKVSSYRSFVNSHPNQTSYFQPILDRLEVVPSRFDIKNDSVVVEGKSDYYILRYAMKLIGKSKVHLLPGLGAGTFGALVALHVGWNLKFLFILDADQQGQEEKERYIKEFGLPSDRISTIGEFLPGVKMIEDILDIPALDYIKNALKLEKSPTKGQIKRFFQERLASDNVHPLSDEFKSKCKNLLDAMAKRLG